MDDIKKIKERYGNSVQHSAEKVRGRLSDVAEKAQVRTQDLWESTSDLIREYPAASVGVALAAGALLAAVFGGVSGGTSLESHAKKAIDRGADSLEETKQGLLSTLASLRNLFDEALSLLK